MTIKILLQGLNRELKFFSEIFSTSILIPVGKEEHTWNHSPC